MHCPPFAFSRPCLVAALLATLLSAAAAENVRFSSGPLSRSVQNESNAAMDRACQWLVARQNPTGFWGKADVRLTAIAALALGGSGGEIAAADNAAVTRAVAWLLTPASTNALPDASSASSDNAAALAWRDMALAVFSPATPAAPLSAPTSSCVKATLAVNEAWRFRNLPRETKAVRDTLPLELYAQLADAPRKRLGELIAEAARRWATEEAPEPWWSDAESAWWFARTVNRVAGGELSVEDGDGFHPLHWRHRLANRWTTTQKMDARGGGFWNGSELDTAFAILLLGEL